MSPDPELTDTPPVAPPAVVVAPVAPVPAPAVVLVAPQPPGTVRKSAIWQGASVLLFLGGFGWFLVRLAELLTDHAAEGWGYFRTPLGVADVLQLIGSSLMMTCGALGINVRDLFARKVPPA